MAARVLSLLSIPRKPAMHKPATQQKKHRLAQHLRKNRPPLTTPASTHRTVANTGNVVPEKDPGMIPLTMTASSLMRYSPLNGPFGLSDLLTISCCCIWNKHGICNANPTSITPANNVYLYRRALFSLDLLRGSPL